MKKYLPYLAGITYSSIFGFSFLFTKECLEIVAPFQLLAYRFSLAALTLTLLYIFKIIKLNFSGKKIGLLLLLAVIQPGLYFVSETIGISLTNSSEAGLMIALIPIVVTILAAFMLREKPGRIQTFFIVLSVTGVFLIVLLKGQGGLTTNYLGLAYLFGAVLMASLYNILSRKLSLSFKPLEITFIMMWAGAILFNLLFFFTSGFNLNQYLAPLNNNKILMAVLYLGVFSSVIAFFLVNYTLAKIKAAQSSVFANLTTIIAILAGVFFRGESFYWFQLIGGLMIISGVWGTNYYSLNSKKSIQDGLH